MPELVERLRGDLRLPSGGLAPAHLVLDGDGLFLCDWSNEEREVRVDVLAARPFGYLQGTFSDELRIGEEIFGVGTGRGDKVCRMIACARIATKERALPGRERFVESVGPVEIHWLRGWLEDEELLLAWLALGQRTMVTSVFGPDADVEAHFLLTTTRAALVAIGLIGDVKLVDLSGVAIEVGQGVRRPIRAGELQLSSSNANGDAFVSLAEATAMAPADRAWAFASMLRSDDRVPAPRRLALLRVAAAERAAAAVLSALLANEEAPDALTGLMDDSSALLELFRDWALGPERAATLVAWARGVDGASDAVVQLHDHVHKAALAAAEGGFAPAAIDLVYAEHLCEAGRFERATALLENRLEDLPSEELRDLLPPADVDLTKKGGGQAVRIAVLDRLATARARGKGRDAATLVDLARLAPLVPERLDELAEARGRAADRVRRYRQTLASRSWTDASPAPSSEKIESLTDEAIEQRLRHPTARLGHSLGSLQSILADAEIPDASALRAYCGRLTDAREDALRTIADVVLALGMKPVEAFVSRGDRSVGVRSYEGDEPFVLIGSDHLDDASPRYLGAAEMRFALAAELAHLRFGHSRVTSMDVWSGAYGKSKTAFDSVASLLPGWRLLNVAKRASTVAGYYDDARVRWAMTKVSSVSGWNPFRKKDARKELGGDPEDLLAAARVMQLTADRVGLLVGGDLHAAVRGICLTREAYAGVLGAAAESSLAGVLAERDEQGAMVRQTLAIRVAALIAFHLGDEWDALRAELSPPIP